MKMNEETLATLFAAGAHSALTGSGMTEKDAEAFVEEVCKAAAARRVRWDEGEDEEEGDTWWSRNKRWALPALIGTGAFILGADAGRNGRPDRSHLSNAGSLLWERVKALVGRPDSALWRTMTETTAHVDSPTKSRTGSSIGTEIGLPEGKPLGIAYLSNRKKLGL